MADAPMPMYITKDALQRFGVAELFQDKPEVILEQLNTLIHYRVMSRAFEQMSEADVHTLEQASEELTPEQQQALMKQLVPNIAQLIQEEVDAVQQETTALQQNA